MKTTIALIVITTLIGLGIGLSNHNNGSNYNANNQNIKSMPPSTAWGHNGLPSIKTKNTYLSAGQAGYHFWDGTTYPIISNIKISKIFSYEQTPTFIYTYHEYTYDSYNGPYVTKQTYNVDLINFNGRTWVDQHLKSFTTNAADSGKLPTSVGNGFIGKTTTAYNPKHPQQLLIYVQSNNANSIYTIRVDNWKNEGTYWTNLYKQGFGGAVGFEIMTDKKTHTNYFREQNIWDKDRIVFTKIDTPWFSNHKTANINTSSAGLIDLEKGTNNVEIYDNSIYYQTQENVVGKYNSLTHQDTKINGQLQSSLSGNGSVEIINNESNNLYLNGKFYALKNQIKSNSIDAQGDAFSLTTNKNNTDTLKETLINKAITNQTQVQIPTIKIAKPLNNDNGYLHANDNGTINEITASGVESHVAKANIYMVKDTGKNAIPNATHVSPSIKPTDPAHPTYDFYANGAAQLKITNADQIAYLRIGGFKETPSADGTITTEIVSYGNNTAEIVYKDGSTSTLNIEISNQVNDGNKSHNKAPLHKSGIFSSTNEPFYIYKGYGKDEYLWIPATKTSSLNINLHNLSNNTGAFDPYNNLVWQTNAKKYGLSTYTKLTDQKNNDLTTEMKNGNFTLPVRKDMWSLTLAEKTGETQTIKIQIGGDKPQLLSTNTPSTPNGALSNGFKTILIIIGIVLAAITTAVVGLLIAKRYNRYRINVWRNKK